MASQPHNLSAAGAMGAQFKTNIFDKVPGKLMTAARTSVQQERARVQTAQQGRERAAESAQRLVGQGRTNFVRNVQARQATAKKAATAQATAVRSGRAAPSPGAPPRTFAMAPTPAAKRAASTMTTQRNTAHAEAIRENAARATTMTRQRNFAHGEALREATQRSRMTSPGTPRVSAPRTATPAPSGGTVQTSTQFANVAPRDNSPFPTHEHPAGSSNLRLESLSAAQPKPNEFTVGSRANKPGGIASKGSQLEAWAISKQKATQARTASRRAGGRDKDLATTAKKAENFANQPLRNFAP